MTVKTATNKPMTIEFLEWTGQNHRAMFNFLTSTEDLPIITCTDKFEIDHSAIDGGLVIKTIEGDMGARIGDMIIKGTKGELYPCRADIFAEKYSINR